MTRLHLMIVPVTVLRQRIDSYINEAVQIHVLPGIVLVQWLVVLLGLAYKQVRNALQSEGGKNL